MSYLFKAADLSVSKRLGKDTGLKKKKPTTNQKQTTKPNSKCHSDISWKRHVNVIYCAKYISKADVFHNLFYSVTSK